MINVIVNGKGGVGKTTTANHVLPYLTESTEIIEIDNNNFSSIYTNSKAITGKTIRTNKKDIENALAEADFDTLDHNIIIDCGGGDDSEKVITAIKNIGLECEFWMPLMPDFETVEVLKNTKKLIGNEYKINLILNNFGNLESDFWFIFGSKDYGFDANLDFLDEFDNVIKVPNSSLFSIAKAYQTTVLDLAQISKGYELNEAKVAWRKMGKEQYTAMLQRHRLSVDCASLLDSI
jgi:cellulose biosynthesis protein BcsQ